MPNDSEREAGGGLKGMYKRVVRRLTRSAFAPAEAELASQSRRLDEILGHVREEGPFVWRGGLEGRAESLRGDASVAFTAKYADEVAFWARCARGQEPGFPGEFHPVFGGWQRDRLRELGRTLGLGDGLDDAGFEDALDAWCAERSCVEIGGGPHPAVAQTRFRWAVMVDPLSEAYVVEELTPRSAEYVVFMPAAGESIGLPSRSADLVIIENALDHVDDPRAVLAECYRLCAPGGLLWLLVDLMDYADHMHPNPLNEDRLRGLLRGAGFEVDSWKRQSHKSHPEAYGQVRVLARRPGGRVGGGRDVDGGSGAVEVLGSSARGRAAGAGV